MNLVCQMPMYLQVWQVICAQEEQVTQEEQVVMFLREKGHMPLGEPDKSLGCTVAFEKSICRHGIADGPCLKVLSGSVGMFCNLGSGLRWVGFHNKHLMPGGLGLNLDIISACALLRQLTKATLVTGRPAAKQKSWCRCEAGAGILLSLCYALESIGVS